MRNFCPACGGLVFGGDRDGGDGINIYAGSLDDWSRFRPTIAVFTRTRPDWAVIPKGMKVVEQTY